MGARILNNNPSPFLLNKACRGNNDELELLKLHP